MTSSSARSATEPGSLRHTDGMELQDWLDTVLAYLRVIVWPAVVTWGVWTFRKQLRDFIDRVRHAKGPGFEVEAAEKVRHLSEKSEALPELAAAQQNEEHEQGDASSDEPDEPDEPATLLGRMLMAWSELEVAARDTAKRRGRPNSGRNLGVLFHELALAGIVSKETERIARSLQSVRNDIVHRATEAILFPSFVDDFTETTRNLATILRAVPGVDPGRTVNVRAAEPDIE